jgi:hypothetical protein
MNIAFTSYDAMTRRIFAFTLLFTIVPAVAEAQTGTVPTTEQEWEQLWAVVNANPFHLATLGREHGADIVVAAVQSRPNGHMWAAFAGTICTVNGSTRVALRDSALVAEFSAARTCFERIEAALPDTVSGPELNYIRSTLAQSLAEVLVEVGALEAADSIAVHELERAASGVPAAGNIVYGMNQVRGRVALRQDRRSEAVEFLHRAAETTGSPQLATFGPHMVLARELLEAGEIDAVRQFLTSIRTFWVSPSAEEVVSEAIAAIDSGRVPDGPRWR